MQGAERVVVPDGAFNKDVCASLFFYVFIRFESKGRELFEGISNSE